MLVAVMVAIVVMAGTPASSAVDAGDDGYWLVAADGGIFAFGDATFHGSMGGQPLNSPIVGMAATTTNDGYWLSTAQGCVSNFGAAPDLGGPCGEDVPFPIVGITRTDTGGGYFLVGAAATVYARGDASAFTGPASIIPGLQAPVVGADAVGADAIQEVAADGGVFAFDTTFHGSMGGQALNAAIVGIAGHHEFTATSTHQWRPS
jgi:hypothetical protein